MIGVVSVHTAAYGLANSDSNTALAIGVVFAAGRLGVELFFLLSGFLLCFIYEFRSVGLKRFTAARFFRIWPLWAFFALFWSLVHLLEGKNPFHVAAGLALSMTFLLWISPEHFEFFLPGAWSIQIEVVCYVLFWILREKSASAILILASVVNIVGIFSSFFSLEQWGVFESLRRLTLNTGLNFFVGGWLLARIYKVWTVNQNFSPKDLVSIFGNKWRDRALLWVWPATFIFSPAIYGNPIEAIGFVSLSILFGLTIAQTRVVQSLFAHVGRRSYFVFFSHFVVLHFIERLGGINFYEPMSFVATPMLVILIVAICTLVAEISFRYLEAPLMRFARRT